MKFNKQFAHILKSAVELAQKFEADAILIMLEGPSDWDKILELADGQRVLVAVDREDELKGAEALGNNFVILKMEEAAVFDKLTQALLESVSKELLPPGADVVAVYSSFDATRMDSLSYIRLEEHLGRLTSRDLRQLQTSVPLDTLKQVVDLAVEIGREGREGKPVGTLFVIGDTRRVLTHCHPAGFDPVRGYGRKERSLADPRVREAIKEIATLDGAMIISADGTIERACQLVDAAHANITISKGLGSRHWAGAAISKVTKSIAVVVSESNGTVRVFQNGEVMLRVEPFQRAMKWKEFDYEPPPSAE